MEKSWWIESALECTGSLSHEEVTSGKYWCVCACVRECGHRCVCACVCVCVCVCTDKVAEINVIDSIFTYCLHQQ